MLDIVTRAHTHTQTKIDEHIWYSCNNLILVSNWAIILTYSHIVCILYKFNSIQFNAKIILEFLFENLNLNLEKIIIIIIIKLNIGQLPVHSLLKTNKFIYSLVLAQAEAETEVIGQSIEHIGSETFYLILFCFSSVKLVCLLTVRGTVRGEEWSKKRDQSFTFTWLTNNLNTWWWH